VEFGYLGDAAATRALPGPPGSGRVCGGAAMPTQYCQAGFYCPDPLQRKVCPEGHYCREGSQQPTRCPMLTVCAEGTETPMLRCV
jgi:hypothetical protein